MKAANVLPGDLLLDPYSGVRFLVATVETVGELTRIRYDVPAGSPIRGFNCEANRQVAGRRPQRKAREDGKKTVAGTDEQ
jgi:hypothetical protein